MRWLPFFVAVLGIMLSFLSITQYFQNQSITSLNQSIEFLTTRVNSLEAMARTQKGASDVLEALQAEQDEFNEQAVGVIARLISRSEKQDEFNGLVIKAIEEIMAAQKSGLPNEQAESPSLKSAELY